MTQGLQKCGPDELEVGDPGVFECGRSEFCVETRGAQCRGLPPPGEDCDPGCVLTPHCCNCPAYACLEPPESACAGGPSCGCVTDDFPVGCPRQECTENEAGFRILCNLVDFDEDPFADGGVFAASEPHQ